MNTTRLLMSPDHIDITSAYQWLTDDPQDGAVVTFVGKVRHDNLSTTALQLEHYPEMALRALQQIALEARSNWSLNRLMVMHRIGKIQLNEPIVFVGVSSAHRHDAFSAAEYIMDILKTTVPIWKKEEAGQNTHWIKAKNSDKIKADRKFTLNKSNSSADTQRKE